MLRKTYYNFLSFLGISKKDKGVGFKNFQQTSAKLAGTNKYIRRFHTPVSVRKSTLLKFYKTNNILKNNVQHRFRKENQFIISSLSEHLEIHANTYQYKNNPQLTYLDPTKDHFLLSKNYIGF